MSKTVKVVMQISEKLLEYINKGKDLSDEQNDEIAVAIANGTVLPKGHGRLIDADVATKSIDAFHDSFVRECDMLSGKFSIVCTAPTVIAADRNCQTCENAKDGKCAGTEECHQCMWESQYKEADNG